MNRIEFQGRVAIVTGGAGGLGRDYCLELARRGAAVVVNDVVPDRVEQVVDAIRTEGGKALGNLDDIGSRLGGESLVRAAEDAFGGVDILISNAGILHTLPFEQTSEEQISDLFRVHVFGAFNVSQPAFRLMRQKGYGRIVFTGSSSGMWGHPWHSAYGAAKTALFGLSNVVALEGAQHGIISNLLMPTAITPMNAEMGEDWTAGSPQVAEVLREIDFNVLMPTLTPPNNTALVIYLVSERNLSTHGAYSVVGGRYAKLDIAVGQGWRPRGGTLATPEEIEANWAAIEDVVAPTRPLSGYDELRTVGAAIVRGDYDR